MPSDSLTIFSSFKSSQDSTCKINGCIDGQNLECVISSSGGMHLYPSAMLSREKIRFALMGPDASWVVPEEERTINPEQLSCARPVSRSRYRYLKDENQARKHSFCHPLVPSSS